MCEILKRTNEKEIKKNKVNYSNVILGSAQFDGKYGIANKKKFSQKNLNLILKIAKEIGINKIDTAFNYKGVHHKIASSKFSKDFEIISKGYLNANKKNSFTNEFYKKFKQV